MPGTPDWQHPTSWNTGNILDADTVDIAPSGTYSSGMLNLTSWQSVILNMYASVGFGTLQFSQYADANLSVLISRYSPNVVNQIPVLALVPIFGAYAVLEITNQSTATMTGSKYCSATRMPAVETTYPRINTAAYQSQIAVAAGTTSTLPIPSVYSGRAKVSFRPYDTSGKFIVSVVTRNPDGVANDVVADLGQPTVTAIYDVSLPNQPCMLNVYNSDTVAHDYRASIIQV